VTDAERHNRLYAIFSEACELPAEGRAAYLDRACGGDGQLRSAVEELLAIDEQERSADWNLADRAPAASDHEAASSPRDAAQNAPIPERIGPYKVREVIGEGGMGMVYRAEQDNPRRDVALKVIRPGIASPRMLKRFELEAQTLGRLHHNGIAQIYEAGTFDSGAGPQPFFAMEFLQGKPLLNYVADHQLGVNDRLELLIRICDAVEHAHAKCVIHRDLKPVNIIVCGGSEDLSSTGSEVLDPIGQPKILDFGVARVTDTDIQATTIGTDIGQIIGTLPYMSPEQVGGQPDDLDTRSDVYALGVIGYELLTNQRPHELAGKSLPEAVRIIREDDPPSLGALNRQYRGDLETIIGKALEKEKQRRYQSPRELAEDLRRFLRNEPIAARPPSALYQVRKFVQRNRAIVTGASIAIIALIVGLAGAVWAQAERQAYLETANMYKSQLKRTLEPPEGGDPLRPQEVDREWLAEATEFVDRRLQREPLEAAELRNLIGLNYLTLDEYDLALEQLTLALEGRQQHLRPPQADLAESLHNLGRVLWHLDAYTEAAAHYRRALTMFESLYGPRHPDVAETMTHVAACLRDQGDHDAALELYQRALDMRHEMFGEVHEDIAANYNNMAVGLRMAGRDEEAVEKFRIALDIIMELAPDPDDLRIARGKRWLGSTLVRLGRFDEAQTLLEDSLEIQTRVLGMNNRYVAAILYELAVLGHARGNRDQAVTTARDALEIQRRVLGDQLDTARTLELLGRIALDDADEAGAIRFFGESVLIRAMHRRPDHADVERMRELLFETAAALDDAALLRSALRDLPNTAQRGLKIHAASERDHLMSRLRRANDVSRGLSRPARQPVLSQSC